MVEHHPYIVVLVTAKDSDEAKKIAQGLLNDKLVACANIVDKIHSIFWWQGKIDSADEVLLVLKSRRDFFNKVASKVKSLHSYDTPEIIAIPIIAGNEDYLNWIDSSVSPQ